MLARLCKYPAIRRRIMGTLTLRHCWSVSSSDEEEEPPQAAPPQDLSNETFKRLIAEVNAFLWTPPERMDEEDYESILEKLTPWGSTALPMVEKIIKHIPDDIEGIIEGQALRYAESDQANEALWALRKIEVPPKDLLNEVLGSLCRLRRWADAKRVFVEFIGTQRVSPNSDTFVTLMTPLVEGGFLDAALHLFFKMPECGCSPNPEAFVLIIEGLCKAGRVSDASSVLDYMYDTSCFPPDSSICRSIVTGLFDQGQAGQALDKLKQMKELGVRPDTATYTTFMHCFCQRGMYEDVYNIFDEMLAMGREPNVFSYSIMIESLCQEDKMEDALVMIKGMHLQHVKPNVSVYNALISAFCKKRNTDKATEMMAKMIEMGVSPDYVTYEAISDGFCKEKNFRRANQVVEEMMIKGFSPSIHTFETLLTSFMLSSDKALHILQKIRTIVSLKVELKLCSGDGQGL